MRIFLSNVCLTCDLYCGRILLIAVFSRRTSKMTVKEFFAPKDMSVGTPWVRIAEFSIPMLIGNIAQQLYNTVDSIVVGKYVGDNALSAVGAAGPILNLLFALLIGVSTGVGILVAQFFGAKDREKLSITIGNCLTLGIISSVFIMIVGSLITVPLLNLLDTPQSIMKWCTDYLLICFIGISGTFFYNILSGVLRGLGDSVSALMFLLVAAGLNVVLDIWFVAGLGMEVAGVALATVIAQFVSALCCLYKLYRMRDIFDFAPKYMKIDGVITGNVIKLGVPSGLTQIIFSMAMLVVQRLTNSFGEVIIAANVVVMRVDGFAMMPNFSFGQAMTMFTGQNVGARKYDRIKKGAIQGTVMAVSVSAFFLALILVFANPLIHLFTDTEELIGISRTFISILAFGYVAMGVTQSLSGVMRGAGDTMTPMWISLITTVVLRVPVAYLIAYLTRTPELPNGSYLALPISLLTSWTAGMLITTGAFLIGRWKKKLPELSE